MMRAMVMLAFLFLGLLSLISLFLEFILPGGLMALMGIALGLGFIWFAFTFGLLLGVSFLFSYSGLALITIICALKFVKRSSLTLEKDQEGYTISEFDSQMVGKEGRVHKDLRPSGIVSIEGKLYQALSEGEYIHKGTKILVVSGRGNTIIVRM